MKFLARRIRFGSRDVRRLDLPLLGIYALMTVCPDKGR